MGDAGRKNDPSWIKTAAIYQIFPLTFNYAGKKEGQGGSAYGNLNGITEKADYIQSLGVNAGWITPFYDSPLWAFGYDIADPKKVGALFGSEDDFRRMVKAFHDRDMKVIIDQVWSHLSITSDLFKASSNPSHPDFQKYKDFFVWSEGRKERDADGNETGTLILLDHDGVIIKKSEDGRLLDKDGHALAVEADGTLTNGRGRVLVGKDDEGYLTYGNGAPIQDDRGNRIRELRPMLPNNWKAQWAWQPNAWEWNEARQAYYLHSFDAILADLNVNNKAVRDHIVEIARYWENLGVDGMRLDAIAHYGHDEKLRDNPPDDKGGQVRMYDILNDSGRQLLREVKAACPSIALLGEQLLSDKGGYGEKKGLGLISEGHCDTYFVGALSEGVRHLRKNIEKTLAAAGDDINGYSINWAMSNHDLERVVTRWFGDKATDKHAKLCLSLLASLPGSICLFQGEELGFINPPLEEVKKGDDPLDLTYKVGLPHDAGRAWIKWQKNGDYSGKWLMPSAAHRSVEEQEADPDSVLNHTRTVMKFRRESLLSEPGTLSFLETSSADTLAFIRQSSTGEQMLCAFNFGRERATVTLPKGSGKREISVEPLQSRMEKISAALEPRGHTAAVKDGRGGNPSAQAR